MKSTAPATTDPPDGDRSRRRPEQAQGGFLLIAAAIHVLLLMAAAFPFGRETLWGTHAWTFLSATKLAGALVLSLLAGFLILRPPPLPTRPAAVVAAAVLSFPALFFFRDRAHLLGDGQLWLAVLGQERAFHPHEPLAFAAALLVTRGADRSVPEDLATRMEVWSSALGAVAVALFLVLAARLSRDRGGRCLILGLLCSAGTLQLGSGYVEAYPLLWVLLTAYLILAEAALSGRGSPVAPAAALGLCAGIHALGFLLLPAQLHVMASRKVRRRQWFASGLSILVPVLLAYGMLPAVMPASSSGRDVSAYGASLWMRVFSEVSLFPYGLTAWALDQVNRWALAGGAAFGLAVAAILARPWKRQSSGSSIVPDESTWESPSRARIIRFLTLCAVALASPALVLNTEGSRGAAADWDAFAVAATPLAALAGVLWTGAGAGSSRRRAGLALALAVGVFGTASFIALNSDPAAASRRFETLVSSFRTPRGRSWGFESLAAYRRNMGDMNGAADLYVKALADQPDNKRLLRNAAGALGRSGRSREAAEVLRRLAELEPGDSKAWFHLGLELEQTGASDSAIAAFRRAVQGNPRFADAMNELARMLLKSPATRGEAYEWIQRSLDIDAAQEHAEEMRSILERLEADGYAPDR